MTKQEFLSGVRFTTPKNLGHNTNYYYVARPGEKGSINRNYLTNTGATFLEDSEVNVEYIGTKGFKGYTFIMDKHVKVSFKFEELVAVKQKKSNGRSWLVTDFFLSLGIIKSKGYGSI